MKKNKFFFTFLFLIISTISLYSSEKQINGYNLCEDFFTFLENNNCNPSIQPLVKNNNYNYPFNIEVFFKANTTVQEELHQEGNLSTLLIAFRLEEAYTNKSLIQNLIKIINSSKRDYNINLLFSYGDSQKPILQTQQVKGTEYFIENIFNQNELSVICINLTNFNTIVTPGGGGDTSPLWLVKRITNALNKNDISFKLRGNTITSLYRLNILQEDKRTSLFLKEGIPTIGINFSVKNLSNSKLLDFFQTLISSYTQNGTNNWDRHFISFTAGNKIYWISENTTVFIFIFLVILSLFFICEFSFTFSNKKHQIKKDVIQLWYILPISALITTIGFVFGQYIALFFYKILGIDPYIQLVIKFSVGFIFVSLIFFFWIKKQGILTEDSYIFLVSISAIINIILYTLVDISLFYVFAAEFIIIYLSRHTKKTVSLSIMFLLMLLPFLPYAIQIIKYLKPQAAQNLSNNSFFANLIISLGFLPFEMIWFRILARLNKIWENTDNNVKKFRTQNIIAITTAVIIFTIILIIITIFIPDQYKRRRTGMPAFETILKHDDKIKISYNDNNYFGETIRTLNIDLGEIAEQCSIKVSSETKNPIIYSDESYTVTQNDESDIFSTPVWPPKELEFNYIASPDITSTITVEAVYPTENPKRYIKRTSKLQINAENVLTNKEE